ncbi:MULTISPECIES: hypothetical protein [Lysinibacillus]|uniref:hypothetical protein n=1 Tax=Lysinibacillus TaxID=400634 RepID=UPI00214AB4FC|nr:MULTISPECIES: hypothetical protein [Lysinibacillus]UUV25933.1 hypothetical protein NP781_04755 [Lysinibacillus sp. FN11]UYB48806.1 hypothetical protein OCI51_07545 [Lysinibacillus capsici]
MQLHRAYDGGDWIYGTAFIQDEKDHSIWWYIGDEDGDGVVMVGKPESSIGETDKNGKEVFLNDVIKHRLGTGVIQYAHGEYYVEWRNGLYYVSRLCILKNTYEVVDNLTEERL